MGKEDSCIQTTFSVFYCSFSGFGILSIFFACLTVFQTDCGVNIFVKKLLTVVGKLLIKFKELKTAHRNITAV